MKIRKIFKRAAALALAAVTALSAIPATTAFAAGAVMVSEKDCPEYIQQRIYQTVREARSSQEYRTLLWDLYGDNCFVDRIISEDDCCVSFDQEGNLCAACGGSCTINSNLFRDSLQNILSQAFLKKQAAAGNPPYE